MHRRTFLRRTSGIAAAGTFGGVLPAALLPGCISAASPTIDRRTLVDRHAPVVRNVEPFSVLSVGNGDFAFTADLTGLQTFPDAYRDIPLATQATWAWHTFPNPNGYRLEDAMSAFDVDGRAVTYPDRQGSPAGAWLRQNPHRLSLARIGFALRQGNGSPARPEDLQEIEQRLDLWTGTLASRFRFDGHMVQVWTWAHPARDMLAVRIEAPGLAASRRPLVIAFPYGDPVHTGDPSDWSHPERHRTMLTQPDSRQAHWHRVLDGDAYDARAVWSEGGRLSEEAGHTFRLTPRDGERVFELVIGFSPAATPSMLPSASEVQAASRAHWDRFWSTGGALDLSESSDSRAPELERRIVLSQYLTAI